MKKEHAANIITAILIIVFVFAGSIMLFNYEAFKGQLSDLPLIKDYAAGIAWRLPAFALILSYFLLWPKSRLMGLYTSVVLLLATAVCMISVIPVMPWPLIFAMNIILLLLTITGIRASKKLPTMIPVKVQS